MAKSEVKNFGEMPWFEIEEFEKRSNAIVIFDRGENSLAFMRAKTSDNENALIIMINDTSEGNTIILLEDELKRLKEFLN